jgi:hypothetical protein
MLVGQRDDEAVKAVGLELLAKSGEAVCIAGHRCYLGPRECGNKRTRFAKVTRFGGFLCDFRGFERSQASRRHERLVH